jgi:cation diffusion facilitator family transporter
MIQRGLKSLLIGIGFNLVLALFKCTTGFICHSFALIADGIEPLSAVISSTVINLGLRLAVKPLDEDHPYGHGKAEPVAAIVVSLALIVAAIVIGGEGIVLIETPPSIARGLHPLGFACRCWCKGVVVPLCLFRGQRAGAHCIGECRMTFTRKEIDLS